MRPLYDCVVFCTDTRECLRSRRLDALWRARRAWSVWETYRSAGGWHVAGLAL